MVNSGFRDETDQTDHRRDFFKCYTLRFLRFERAHGSGFTDKVEGEICIQITDDGIPFNPLEHQAGASTDPASSVDRGMGLTLIKTFSNSITYQRVESHNQLFISKKIKSNKPSGL